MGINITLPESYYEALREELDEVLLQERPNGVYVFYSDDGRCLYIGQSSNLLSRFKSHFSGAGNSADFYRLIHIVRIYFVDDPYFREIYETFAITELKAEFNRAKTYKARGIPRIKRELLEDYRTELSLAKIRRNDLYEDLKTHLHNTKKPKFRAVNNFTGEFTKGFLETIASNRYEQEAENKDYEKSLRADIAEINEEIEEINENISDILEEFRLR